MEDVSKLVSSLEQQIKLPNIFSEMNSKAAAINAKFAQDAVDRQANIAALNHLGDVSKASLASEFCSRLEHQMKLFDAALDQEHEVGMKLVTYGQAVTIHVSYLGFHDPSLI